ncbi:hypothetical protein MTO96_027550 [Rhipicephalus appendiculatus]
MPVDYFRRFPQKVYYENNERTLLNSRTGNVPNYLSMGHTTILLASAELLPQPTQSHDTSSQSRSGPQAHAGPSGQQQSQQRPSTSTASPPPGSQSRLDHLAHKDDGPRSTRVLFAKQHAVLASVKWLRSSTVTCASSAPRPGLHRLQDEELGPSATRNNLAADVATTSMMTRTLVTHLIFARPLED